MRGRQDEVALDLAECGWFDAEMSGPLGCILDHIKNNLSFEKVGFCNIPAPIEDILSRNFFLCDYGYKKACEPAHTAVQYKNFAMKQTDLFYAYMVEGFKGKGVPAMSPPLKNLFMKSLLEIFDNASTHSMSELGVFACGQFFPNRGQFRFSITDGGIGFKGSLERELGIMCSCQEAIALAFTQGFTTKKSNTPGGLGLKLLKEFIDKNQGRLVVVSGDALWTRSLGEEELYSLDHPFPGSIVEIEINTHDGKRYTLDEDRNSQIF